MEMQDDNDTILGLISRCSFNMYTTKHTNEVVW